MSAHPPPEPSNGRGRPVVMTIPTMITIARLGGSLGLLWLAHAGYPETFVVLFAVLVLSDWIDGKLAILLDQRTVIGARLDSVADVVLYTCLLLGTARIKPGILVSEGVLVGVMVGSYAIAVGAALARFRKLPAYHTRAAKTCWFLVAAGAIILLLDGPVWPAQVAMVAVILTNVEATAITVVLKQWEPDVPSIWHALRRSRRA